MSQYWGLCISEYSGLIQTVSNETFFGTSFKEAKEFVSKRFLSVTGRPVRLQTNSVKIGCQTIPFAAINLAKKIIEKKFTYRGQLYHIVGSYFVRGSHSMSLEEVLKLAEFIKS